MPKKLPPEVEEAIAGAYAAGDTSTAIAARLGVSATTVSRVLARRGEPARPRGRRAVPPDVLAAAVADYAAGATAREVSRRRGVCSSLILRAVRDAGLPVRPACRRRLLATRQPAAPRPQASCAWCGSGFTPRHGSHATCSRECARSHARRYNTEYVRRRRAARQPPSPQKRD